MYICLKQLWFCFHIISKGRTVLTWKTHLTINQNIKMNAICHEQGPGVFTITVLVVFSKSVKISQNQLFICNICSLHLRNHLSIVLIHISFPSPSSCHLQSYSTNTCYRKLCTWVSLLSGSFLFSLRKEYWGAHKPLSRSQSQWICTAITPPWAQKTPKDVSQSYSNKTHIVINTQYHKGIKAYS